MSISQLLNSQYPLSNATKNWFDASCDSLQVLRGINFNGSGITNLSSINGNPIPNFDFTINAVNIIYRPGGPVGIGTNIFITWAAVIAHANQININQTLIIWFDNSVVESCPITTSYDFQGRAIFRSALSSSIQVSVTIADGVLISNVREIDGIGLNISCQSITGPCMAFKTDAEFNISNNSTLSVTSDSVVPAITLNSSNLNINLINGSNLDNSLNPTNPVINCIDGAVLVIQMNESSETSSNTISSDLASSVYINYDSFVTTIPTQTGVLGTLVIAASELSKNVYYNDSVSPHFNVNDVQDAIDYIKVNYSPGGNVIQTYSPTISDGAGHNFTTSSVSGKYIVNGLQTTAIINLTWTNQGSAVGGNPVIISLPSTSTYNCAAGMVFTSGAGWSTSSAVAYAPATTSHITLWDNFNATAILCSQASPAGSITLQISYF